MPRTYQGMLDNGIEPETSHRVDKKYESVCMKALVEKSHHHETVRNLVSKAVEDQRR